MQQTIAELKNEVIGIKAVVNERIVGNYEVVLWDTDVDKVVGVKYLPDERSALKYAEKCVDNNNIYDFLRNDLDRSRNR